MRYVIVGNGVAGTKAAETIGRRDQQAEVIVVSDEQDPFYRRPALVEHLAGRVSRESLVGRPEAFYQELGLDLRLGNAAVGLNPQEHQLSLADGEVLSYDRLLLAVGVDRKTGLLPGAELGGIVSLRRLGDLPKLRKAADQAMRAVVLGEGVIGLETARAFRLLGLEVTYLLPGPRFWPEVLSPDASMLIERRLRSQGVYVHPGQQVQGFEGSAGRVRAVQTRSGTRFEAEAVGLSSPFEPPLDWAKMAGLAVDQHVWVDDHLSTTLPDVFAAGDAVRLPGEVLSLGWQRAWHQGVVAGVNMTGNAAPYRRRTVSLSTQAFGMPVLVMGDPHPEGKFRRERGDYPQEGVHKELVLDADGRVVGAVMVGEVSEASRVEALVRSRAPYGEVDPDLRRRLFDSHYWAGPGEEILCPVCKFLVQVGEEELRLGRVTCPICGAEFTLHPEGGQLKVELA